MHLHIEIDREEDGRWIAEVPEIPGVMVYGATEIEAIRKVKSLALTVLADQIAHGEFDGFESIAFAQQQAARVFGSLLRPEESMPPCLELAG